MNRRNHLTYNAPVTLTFVFLCLGATLLGRMSGGAFTRKFFSTYRMPLVDPLLYMRLLTHVLGHAGWEHFLGNATYLLLLGPMLEEKYGSEFLVHLIVRTALVTGLFNNILFPHVALCGASGVVFAFIVLASFTEFRAGEIPLTFVLVIVFYVGQQIVLGLLVQDNVSNLSHILGGLMGAVEGYRFNRR